MTIKLTGIDSTVILFIGAIISVRENGLPVLRVKRNKTRLKDFPKYSENWISPTVYHAMEECFDAAILENMSLESCQNVKM